MINLFCALYCEAEPLINQYQLSELRQFDLFRIFQSEDKQIALTITGIGKLNAASAVTYHHANLKTSGSDVWLNVGVAGHKSMAIGEVCLVNKITDNKDLSCWYPQILFQPSCKTEALITVSEPSTDYEQVLYDMEATGFYSIATRLGTSELIHCLKIVSDNDQHSTQNINKGMVKDLLTKNLDVITSIIDELKVLSNELYSISQAPSCYQAFIKKWHFTATERIQLERLLRQWSKRLPDTEAMQSANKLTSGKSVLRHLQNAINESGFVIYD